jgi:phosphatidylglycerol---prolipoprotein diacylglyceryl transferase
MLMVMIYWDPDPDLIIIPILNWPIKWYGLFFALGFVIGFSLFERILLRFFLQEKRKGSLNDLQHQALKVTDRITVYTVLATAVGARLGHFIFYERPSEYLINPIEILQIWKGGLASHGAAIAIIITLFLLSRWTKKIDSGLTCLRLLDFICVPTALAGSFIRIGNLFNQEILGTPTNLPWGVVFGHPADGSLSIARHPVQVYEALFYFIVFLILWRLAYRPTFLLKQGRLIGLFLILVFGFRFFIEFFKLEQSQLLSASSEFTMGQWLSIPLVILGVILFAFSRRDRRTSA